MKTLIAVLAILWSLSAPAANCAGLAAPTGQVILKVTGKIDTTNADGAAEFDLAMLDALKTRETTAATPWYDAPHTFEGTLLSQVLEAAGAHGTALKVRAINGYEAVIPLADVASYPIILATRLDGRVMSVRDKGPIFVIYPFDLHPELYNEVYFTRSVWQVESLEVI